MNSSRENRLLVVQRLAEEGLTQMAIAKQVGVHARTVADDFATLRSRKRLPNLASRSLPSIDTAPLSLSHHAAVPAPDEWTPPRLAHVAWASTPRLPGLYKWFLNGPLPVGFDWASDLSSIKLGDLIYVGQATNLRTRAKHHRLGTARSTFRRTLSSLCGYPAYWVGKSAHPRLLESDEAALTEWMTNNLLMSYRILDSKGELREAEARLRAKSRAPLNKDSLTPEQKYASAVGLRWTAQAI